MTAKKSLVSRTVHWIFKNNIPLPSRLQVEVRKSHCFILMQSVLLWPFVGSPDGVWSKFSPFASPLILFCTPLCIFSRKVSSLWYSLEAGNSELLSSCCVYQPTHPTLSVKLCIFNVSQTPAPLHFPPSEAREQGRCSQSGCLPGTETSSPEYVCEESLLLVFLNF